MLGEWEGLISNLEKHIKASSTLDNLDKSSNLERHNKSKSPLHEQTSTHLARLGKENSEPAELNSSQQEVHKSEKDISQGCDQEKREREARELQKVEKKEEELSQDLNSSRSSPQMVACSICSVPIAPSHLEKHQEHCASLQKSFTAPPPSKPVNSRPQLPKLVYALLKETELRKKCKEAGLNWKGDKNTLTKRHKRFSLLYNVEREADRPRPNAVLAAQVATYLLLLPSNALTYRWPGRSRKS